MNMALMILAKNIYLQDSFKSMFVHFFLWENKLQRYSSGHTGNHSITSDLTYRLVLGVIYHNWDLKGHSFLGFLN